MNSDLRYADLTGANLTNADLTHADLTDANLNFTGVTLNATQETQRKKFQQEKPKPKSKSKKQETKEEKNKEETKQEKKQEKKEKQYSNNAHSSSGFGFTKRKINKNTTTLQPPDDCPSKYLDGTIEDCNNYKKLTLKLHPDKNIGCQEEATKKFQDLQDDYNEFCVLKLKRRT